MGVEIDLVSGEENARLIGSEMNHLTTFRIATEGDTMRLTAAIAGHRPRAEGGGDEPCAHPVVDGALIYAAHLWEAWRAGGRTTRPGFEAHFQCNDTPVDAPGVAWESRHDFERLRLVPDLYYFRALGYEHFNPDPPAWKARDDVVGWRGATTGLPRFGADELDDLLRYRAVKIVNRLPGASDVGLSAVVQERDAAEGARIRERLESEGFLRPYKPFEEFGRYRYVLDLPGNANAWNFVEKLKLGCCVFRVDCPWEQWFEPRLIPWQHYVPVAADLSDLAEKIDWCRSQPGLSEEIALEGRAFARDMRYADEMDQAAAALFG